MPGCTMMIRAGVVAVLLTMTPQLALAECAWVLWEEILGSRDPRVERSLPNAGKCYAALSEYLEDRKIPASAIVTRRRDHADYMSDSIKSIVRLRCIPDTIDPRGPKGR